MVEKLFTPEEIEILKSNPYTARVSEKTISFTRAFKEAFWNGYQEGRGPIQLVRELGYDTDILGRRRVDGLAKRIRAEADSVQGFRRVPRIMRSAASCGANPRFRLTILLSSECRRSCSISGRKWRFKKTYQANQWSAMINDKPSAKFEIIRETLEQADNVLHIKTLCEIAGVSRAGYYKWLHAEPERKEREQKDQNDFALVLKAYQHRGYNKGARSIHMHLLHQQSPIAMNIKKIRRLMEKYNLFCPIRKANPYRRMMRAMRTSHVSLNLLDRNFTTMGPRMALLTDITYIPFNGTLPVHYSGHFYPTDPCLRGQWLPGGRFCP